MTSLAVLLGEATVALVAEQHVGELMPGPARQREWPVQTSQIDRHSTPTYPIPKPLWRIRDALATNSASAC